MKKLPLDPFNALLHRGSIKLDSAPRTILKNWKIIVKDNLLVEGWPLTCASKSLQEYVAPEMADIAKSVLEMGGEIVGKANMDEFGMG